MAIHIKADSDTLARQTSMSADDYLRAAVRSLDETFGDGFAKKNPELVGKYMETCVRDLNGAIIARALEEIAEAVHTIQNMKE